MKLKLNCSDLNKSSKLLSFVETLKLDELDDKLLDTLVLMLEDEDVVVGVDTLEPVSYTHLTLPTSDLV